MYLWIGKQIKTNLISFGVRHDSVENGLESRNFGLASYVRVDFIFVDLLVARAGFLPIFPNRAGELAALPENVTHEGLLVAEHLG